MVDIYLNSENLEYSFESFHTKFLKICKKHKDANRALAFAIILYDFRNPQIAKILRDDDLHFSLNAISGDLLTIFSINYDPSRKNIQKLMSERISGPPTTKWLTAVNSSPFSLEDNTNSLIEKYFGDINVNYPSVLFFQIDEDKVIDYTLIQLDQKDYQLAFQELQTYIIRAVEALQYITPENKHNHQQIFSNLEDNVKGERAKVVTLKTVRKITSIGELAGTIAGLGS